MHDVAGTLDLGSSQDPVVHTVGTCLFMDECEAVTKATGVSLSTVCRGPLRYGSSSGKEEKAAIRDRVPGRSPSPQACRFSALSPVHTPSPGSPHPSPRAHCPAPCRVVREEESREEDGGPWGMQPDCGSPRTVRLVTLEVAYLLPHRAILTSRQASHLPSALPQPWAFHRPPGHRGPHRLSPSVS